MTATTRTHLLGWQRTFRGSTGPGLLFAATCREILALREILTSRSATPKKVSGKLPDTTGWQPALPGSPIQTFLSA